MAETDAEFVERVKREWDGDNVPCVEDFDQLIAIARRGAEAAARIQQLEAALRECENAAGEHHAENVSRCEWSGSSLAQKKARAVAARSGVLLHAIKRIARAALEETKHE